MIFFRIKTSHIVLLFYTLFRKTHRKQNSLNKRYALGQALNPDFTPRGGDFTQSD